jgi:hypothetical protein
MVKSVSLYGFNGLQSKGGKEWIVVGLASWKIHALNQNEGSGPGKRMIQLPLGYTSRCTSVERFGLV